MILRLAFIVCIIPAWLSGCASVATGERSGELAPMSEVVASPDTALDSFSVKPCQRTERDLTVAWRAKRYLCTHENRRVALQQVNDGEIVASHYSIKPLVKPQAVKESAFITPAVATVPTAVHEDVRYASLPLTGVPRVQSPKPDNTQVFRVWFPRNGEVLGPRGIEKALAMIPAVTDAQHVTLLGVYEATEFPNTASLTHERERFSVGRALSVKKLWRREGVDLDKVKILHHQNHLSGRYVEVTLND
ncbi:MAG: hypothetical protein ABFR65_11670 [Pseudomonadota bacterium]